MSDDDDNDQGEDYQDGQGSHKNSLNKYFNKSFSSKEFLNMSNIIKLSNGLKLSLDGSVKANQDYKGKCRLDFELNKQTKFKLNYNQNDNKVGMSAKNKGKNPHSLLDHYDVSLFVDSKQQMNMELNLSKKLPQKDIQIKLNNRFQLKGSKIDWKITSKFMYTFPEVIENLSNKMTLKLKKLTPQLMLNSTFKWQRLNFFFNAKFSESSPKQNIYLQKFQLQVQHENLTSILEHHKSSTLYFHFLLDPYSIGVRFRKPDDKNWWEIALNHRLSSKRLIQLSFDNKRLALLTKQNLNPHTHFYLKWYNNYNSNIFKGLKNNIEIGFRFND